MSRPALVFLLIAPRLALAGAGETPALLVRSVRPANPPREAKVLSYGLRRADVDRIRADVAAIRGSASFREVPRTFRSGSAGPVLGLAVGITADYPALDGLTIAVGRTIARADDERRENVAVLGSEVARLLFPGEGERPIGKPIKVGADYYTIVGVLKPRTSSVAAGADWRDLDLDVFLPLNTMQLRIGERLPPDPPRSNFAEDIELSGAILAGEGLAKPVPCRAVAEILARLHPRGDVVSTVIPRRNP